MSTEGDFSILSEQDPSRVLSFAIFLLILLCREHYALGITYLMKVFSLLSLTRNLENFTTKRITTALISCIAMWLCTFLVYTPHTIQVWGLVSFIFSWAFQSLSLDKRKSAPHFLFLVNMP